jgi:hypothetical protein
MTEEHTDQLTPAGKVICELGIPKHHINIHSRLSQDLDVDPASALILLEAFSVTFEIDIDDFRINDYFGVKDSTPVFFQWIMWFFGNSKPYRSLTVKDLIQACEKGHLK